MARKFYLRNHQNKGRLYHEALVSAGYEYTDNISQADFSFFDHEYGPGGLGFHPRILKAAKRGPVFLYPHAARPQVICDIYTQVFPYKMIYVATEGHKQILETLNYPNPMTVVGWHLSEIRPFQAPNHNGPLRILFAPMHPNGNGFLDSIDADSARRVEEVLYLLSTAGKATVTLRHIMSLPQNGLKQRKEFRYVTGLTNGSTNDMDNTDVVIAHQTYAWMAVALGKPTIMYLDTAPHSGNRPPLKWAENYYKYKRLMKFPFDFEDYPTKEGMEQLLQLVIKPTEEVEEWKARMIGEPFNAEKLIASVRSLL